MLFNSFIFVLFFIIVYTLYLFLNRNYKAQNILLLIASYVFYGWWDWRFLSLLALSTVVDFTVGKQLQDIKEERKRKLLLCISLIFNLSLLGFFKYFNFFAESFSSLLKLVGLQVDWVTLTILLPVGISFYTFQTMSYTIDIYRGKLKPISNFLDFALFVSFFPQLVAGPIERATTLIPQIILPRNLNIEQINAGILLIIWGYFKKVVIADNMATIANPIFNNYTQYQGLDVLIGILAFTVQIYGDFSGYSDIARGISKLMGFELMVNFKLPYFALNPSDFWLRWHISLSTWLRDYLYIPLGGNRQGSLNTYRNLFLTMLLGGLWHGAAWNFVIWGAFHGLILIIYRIFDKNPEHQDPWSGKYSYLRILGKMLLMFILTNIGWVIFRSSSADQIYYMLTRVGVGRSDQSLLLGYDLVFFCLPLVMVQIYQYVTRDLLILTKLNYWCRVPVYSFLIIWICVFGVRTSGEFIYFQF
ncbi:MULTISPECIES: MBOAT family O-acyltransferase [Moorena]|uniref:Putative membrane protein involved in D-alanine export n=1 Tax=Moorena producens 3L TaxID=489825 RepID=F4XK41_9CYAN|nr:MULTISPECIES: MBOAT family O-acyltransferase [Moorena]EGJ35000.1 putative membrane protein involved in D-alanine export [Moorena producens 3L]NEP35749.1 MBOAT family protein [Moorena sp. SIO3B2]NEP67600.1 MBOAT family protein [Moorena sp. SIO3A5]NEQ04531.1 MBOAT family protein [Moorena sp. SIO4E2]NER86924.1 MBOAT family protein [Moorena sp. SIO3A2]